MQNKFQSFLPVTDTKYNLKIPFTKKKKKIPFTAATENMFLSSKEQI